jgi:DMSO/TMAO reductase YedYZ heme-binding membrane subunit
MFALLFINKDFTKLRILAFFGLIAGLLTAGIMIGIYLIEVYRTGSGPIDVLNSAPIAAFFVTLLFFMVMLLLAPKRNRDQPHGASSKD